MTDAFVQKNGTAAIPRSSSGWSSKRSGDPNDGEARFNPASPCANDERIGVSPFISSM
jgi:hypothetical protein